MSKFEKILSVVVGAAIVISFYSAYKVTTEIERVGLKSIFERVWNGHQND